jgi:hypothetical protein
MDTQNTPGPFYIHDGERFDLPGQIVITDENATYVIAAIDNDERGRANARLLVAAPQLLDALETLVFSETVDRRDYEDAEFVISEVRGKP